MSFDVNAIIRVEDKDETILDYDYISEENFLVIVALTNTGKLHVITKNFGVQKVETTTITDIYPEWHESILLVITPDASTICLVQTNGSVIILPLKSLIEVSWGVSSSICSNPILISIDTGHLEPLHKLPTAAVSFTSRLNHKSYLAYGNKGGKILVIDLNVKTVVAWISAGATIENMEYYSDTGSGSLIVTHFVGAQILVKVESEHCGVRETLAHAKIEEINYSTGDKFSCHHVDNAVIALNPNASTVKVFANLNGLQELPLSTLKVPQYTWDLFYSQKYIISVTDDNHVYLNLHFIKSESGSPKILEIANVEEKFLGIVPIISSTDELDDCVFATEKQIVVCTPKISINELVLKFLATEYFSPKLLVEIAMNLQREPQAMAKTLLEVALKRQADGIENECELNGALALTLELKLEMPTIIQTLAQFNQSDLIIPFLMARCERDPQQWSALLELYITKLRKLPNKQLAEDEAKKAQLEADLNKCFMKCTATKETFMLLLKHNMWSCISMLLSKESDQFTETVAAFLLESPTLREISKSALSTCLSFFDWSTIESITGPLLKKLVTCLFDVTTISQLGMFASIGENLIPKAPGPATVFYAISTIRFLQLIQEDPSFSLYTTPTIIAMGSNCAAVIGEDNMPYFWGEFTAGTLKFRTDPRKATSVINGKADVAATKSGSHLKQVLLPEKFDLPTESGVDLRIVAVAAGTEHVLMLTLNGAVYACGRNRYGQCGVGHRDFVFKPTRVEPTYGRATHIFAGHYHSGIINEQNEVFLWGWAMYGQLATDGENVDDFSPILIPQKVTCLPTDSPVKTIALGYAHTLFLFENGKVYGCGSSSVGQLAYDPSKISKITDSLTPIKQKRIKQIPIVEHVKLLSSTYFHAVAITKSNKIYEWGIAPHTLRMRAFLIKRFNNSQRNAAKKEGNGEPKKAGEDAEDPMKSLPEKVKTELSKEYMKLHLVTQFPEKELIEQVSAGYSHNAIITENGDLYTWGKSLDMQLGHGNKVEKEAPWKLVEPYDTKWKYVVAGRCSTMAISSCGRVYVWGRNDKSQLGHGNTKKAETQRKVFLRSNNKQAAKSVELPNDNCIVRPTPLPGLHAAVSEMVSYTQREQTLTAVLAKADQQTLVSISRYLSKHPVPVFPSVFIHLSSGDVLNAVELLVTICENSKLLSESNKKSATANTLSAASVPSRSVAGSPISPIKGAKNELNRNTLSPSPMQKSTDDKNGNASPTPDAAPQPLLLSPGATAQLDQFDASLDKTWNLVRIHPFKDVQTLAILRMLQARFPIYNRLAADSRLCRLVDPFLEYPPSASSSASSSVHSSDSAGSRKLVDLVVRERFSLIKVAKVSSSKAKAVRQRLEHGNTLDQLRYYADCSHYEKCVIESGHAKAEFAAMRSRLRKCSRCVAKGRPPP
uniref:Kinetochore-associated protein 1 n=1 Tax=Panagrellus redivivus TaxID=6233 RepID=A0A7E4W7S9_PANRE